MMMMIVMLMIVMLMMMMMIVMVMIAMKVVLQTLHNDMLRMVVGQCSHGMLVDRLTHCQ